MIGGANEHVMGNYNDIVEESGFTSMPELKYYDKYITSDINTACNGKECISHALSDTYRWYSDYHSMINEEFPFMIRSGRYDGGEYAGIFAFTTGGSHGGAYSDYSFRIVSTIK